MIERKKLLLYAVTDRSHIGEQTLYEQVEQALAGGVTCVQLREKHLDETELLHEAVEIGRLCHAHGVPLIVNDNVRVAIDSGADGVHLGQEDGSVREVRKMAGADFIIGVTAKTVEQAKHAYREGADYLGVGAVFPSPTKQNAIRITREQLKEICGAVDIPAVAIGGIGRENIRMLADCGISGVAVVSAIFGAEDIKNAAAELQKSAKEIISQV